MAFHKEGLSRTQIMALSYYSRKSVQQAIFEFCKSRETVGNFNNKFFSKRPDQLDYPSDIFNSAKQGVTSFHCSEELWEDPLKITTDMTPQQYNHLRIGWDLLIDIDSKYLDYSKIAAKYLLKALEMHGIKNYGIKFSGSKGFHILVPFKAFPQEFEGQLTKDNFPEWPRAISEYLLDLIKEPMNKEILDLSSREDLEKEGELISKHICPRCGKQAKEKKVSKYKCPNFKCRAEMTSMKSSRKHLRCPSCNGNMDKIGEEIIFFCEHCNLNTKLLSEGHSKMKFKEELTTKSTQDSIDIVLVSPRHLFRAPYSLHEKTALASIVLEKDQIKDFKPSDAQPLKIKQVKSFMPNAVAGEASKLLFQALDKKKKEPVEKKNFGKEIDISGLIFSEDIFPPIIQKVLEGVKSDGRKRALSLLLSFYTSLNFPQEYIEKKINEWNKKNYHPLRYGYVMSQISWHMKHKRLPPNYDKPIYKIFGLLGSEEEKIKNPINYTIRLALKNKRGKAKKSSRT